MIFIKQPFAKFIQLCEKYPETARDNFFSMRLELAVFQRLIVPKWLYTKTVHFLLFNTFPILY